MRYPQSKEGINIKRITFQSCLRFGSYWNKATKPSPALVINPASRDAKVNVPFANNSQRITVAAQFGMKPNREASNG